MLTIFHFNLLSYLLMLLISFQGFDGIQPVLILLNCLKSTGFMLFTVESVEQTKCSAKCPEVQKDGVIKIKLWYYGVRYKFKLVTVAEQHCNLLHYYRMICGHRGVLWLKDNNLKSENIFLLLSSFDLQLSHSKYKRKSFQLWSIKAIVLSKTQYYLRLFNHIFNEYLYYYFI